MRTVLGIFRYPPKKPPILSIFKPSDFFENALLGGLGMVMFYTIENL